MFRFLLVAAAFGFGASTLYADKENLFCPTLMVHLSSPLDPDSKIVIQAANKKIERRLETRLKENGLSKSQIDFAITELTPTISQLLNSYIEAKISASESLQVNLISHAISKRIPLSSIEFALLFPALQDFVAKIPAEHIHRTWARTATLEVARFIAAHSPRENFNDLAQRILPLLAREMNTDSPASPIALNKQVSLHFRFVDTVDAEADPLQERILLDLNRLSKKGQLHEHWSRALAAEIRAISETPESTYAELKQKILTSAQAIEFRNERPTAIRDYQQLEFELLDQVLPRPLKESAPSSQKMLKKLYRTNLLGEFQIQNPRLAEISENFLPHFVHFVEKLLDASPLRSGPDRKIALQNLLSRLSGGRGVRTLWMQALDLEAQRLGQQVPRYTGSPSEFAHVLEFLKPHLSINSRLYENQRTGFEPLLKELGPSQLAFMDQVLSGPSGLSTALRKRVYALKGDPKDFDQTYQAQVSQAIDVLRKELAELQQPWSLVEIAPRRKKILSQVPMPILPKKTPQPKIKTPKERTLTPVPLSMSVRELWPPFESRKLQSAHMAKIREAEATIARLLNQPAPQSSKRSTFWSEHILPTQEALKKKDHQISQELESAIKDWEVLTSEYFNRNIRLIVRPLISYKHDFWDDLEGPATIGLWNAVRGFDPERGFQFSVYAVRTIKNALHREMGDLLSGEHSEETFQMLSRWRQLKSSAWLERGEKLTLEDLMKEFKVPRKTALLIVSLENGTIPLNAPIRGAKEKSVVASIAAPQVKSKKEEEALARERATLLNQFIDALEDARIQKILRDYYGFSKEGITVPRKTLEEIAQDLGIGRARVHQLKKMGENELKTLILEFDKEGLLKPQLGPKPAIDDPSAPE